MDEEIRASIAMFQSKPLRLEDAPKSLVAKYGYPAVANMLIFELPTIPKPRHGDEILKYISSHTFRTIDHLADYIKKWDRDLDKLYGIFVWAALNLEYDVESFMKGIYPDQSAEAVFVSKLCVCAGYSNFFIGVAKRVNIQDIEVGDYSNYAKAFGYDVLDRPKEMKVDHASVFIKINGESFICEPTWAAGSLGDDMKFSKEFKSDYFLQPIRTRLSRYYPGKNAYKYLPVDVSFDAFKESVAYDMWIRGLKTESHPFERFTAKDGYVEMQFSYIGSGREMSSTVKIKKGTKWEKVLSDSWVSIVIMENEIDGRPGRNRSKVCMAFPAEGIYNVTLYLDCKGVINYYIDVDRASSVSVPALVPRDDKLCFWNMTPDTLVSNVNNGVGVVRFAVTTEKPCVLLGVHKVSNLQKCERLSEIKDRWKTATLVIPFDSSRYEDCIVITFPENGIFEVNVYLAPPRHKQYAWVTRYYMVVRGAGANAAMVYPEHIIGCNREYGPVNMDEGFWTNPTASAVIVKDRICQMQLTMSDAHRKVRLCIESEDNDVIASDAHRKEIDDCECYFQWMLPGPGHWKVKVAVNNMYVGSITYIYFDGELSKESSSEKSVMRRLEKDLNAQGAQKVVRAKKTKTLARKWGIMDLLPFEMLTLSDGYMEREFGKCGFTGGIRAKCSVRRGNAWTEVNADEWISFQSVDVNDPDSQRLCIYASFPRKDFYMIQLCGDSEWHGCYFVNVLRPSTKQPPMGIPVVNWPRFVPIMPLTKTSTVVDGVGVFRFAVNIANSGMLTNVHKINNFEEQVECSELKDVTLYTKLTIPFDDTRYENFVCVTFRSDGLYKVQIFLANGKENSYSSFITYLVRVSGAEIRDCVHPTERICNNREFAPAQITKGFSISPQTSVVVVSSPKCRMVVHKPEEDSTLLLNFNSRDPKNNVTHFPTREEDGKNVTATWSIPSNGVWSMVLYSGSSIGEQQYVYREQGLRQPSPAEAGIMEQLRARMNRRALDNGGRTGGVSGRWSRQNDEVSPRRPKVTIIESSRLGDGSDDNEDDDIVIVRKSRHSKDRRRSRRGQSGTRRHRPGDSEMTEMTDLEGSDSSSNPFELDSNNSLSNGNTRQSKKPDVHYEQMMFTKYDSDKDRMLGVKELQRYFDSDDCVRELGSAPKVMKRVTGRADGKMSFAEFVMLIRNDEHMIVPAYIVPPDDKKKRMCCILV